MYFMANKITVVVPYASCETVSLILMDSGLSELAAGLLLQKNDLTDAYGRMAPNYDVYMEIDIAACKIGMEAKPHIEL